MDDVQFIEDDEAPACHCCRCRRPVPKHRHGEGAAMLAGLQFLPVWLYFLVTEAPTMLRAFVDAQ